MRLWKPGTDVPEPRQRENHVPVEPTKEDQIVERPFRFLAGQTPFVSNQPVWMGVAMAQPPEGLNSLIAVRPPVIGKVLAEELLHTTFHFPGMVPWFESCSVQSAKGSLKDCRT